MIRHPLAGNILAYYQYVHGLSLLGHEVIYLEESGWPNSCYDPVNHRYTNDPRAGMRALQAAAATLGCQFRSAFVDRNTRDVHGMEWAELKRVLSGADVLLNIGGVCWLPEFRLCRHLVYIDMDPLFTQIGRFGHESLHEHHAHFSYGTNVGRQDCSVPSAGIEWQPTVPPVVPDLWPVRDGTSPDAAFTTIANWSAYGAITWQGEEYGQKDREFERVLDLPKRSARALELALAADSTDVARRLRTRGWAVRDAGEVSRDLGVYRDYVSGSRGEFSCAKHAYVATRSGWFSDRSVCYLASGRPVVVQDTGFSDWLPSGRGVLPFSTLDEAVERIEEVEADYLSQRRWARQMAEEHFAYQRVLPRLLAGARE
jgi:hypothetical protein